ncbi:MAG TPA: MIP/aquaporin family protein [Terracidiphilus sp.]|nr:MIP/aquaporin family protein [Terracidiphilus sp.]
MHSPWFGEFMGTLVLILLGDGVNAGVTLRKSYAEKSGWIVIATGWALAVMCGVMVAQGFGSHDAAINPAVTLAGAIVSGHYTQVAWLWSAQLLGAMCGAGLVALHYGPHWRETPDPAAKLGVFCTGPAISAPLWNVLSEIIGTAVLVLVAGAIFSPGVAEKGPAGGIGPWLVGSLVWGIGLSLGGTTGYAINPARDFGPRLVHALAPIPGKGGSNWRYSPIPVLGPLIGGALAGLLIHFAHPW